jgi:hypothetical protein
LDPDEIAKGINPINGHQGGTNGFGKHHGIPE